ncbi:MAG: hypothetical protein ACLP8X_01245 [Streptosporangiaceae bacterium]
MPSDLTLSLLMGPVKPEPVARPVIESLVSASVNISATGTSGFDLTFAVSKGSPLLTDLLPSGYFDPPARVILVATLAGTVHVLMDGVITLQEMVPADEPGQSVLSVKGEDLTRMLDLVDLSGFPYPCMPAPARVALAVAKYIPLYGIVPVVMPSVLMDVPNPVEEIPLQEGTDLDYIQALAAEAGYVFFIQPGPLPGMNLAYWGPMLRTSIPFLPTPPPIAIDWDGASNVESLQFSFDGFAKTQWVVWILADGVTVPVPVPDTNPISPPLGQKEPLPLQIKPMSGLAKYTPVQAAGLALARAAATANVISGSGSLDVMRYGAILPARTLVEVRGAGVTYDGQYFVESTSHTIKRGSYKQGFTLSRNRLIASGTSPLSTVVQQLGGFAAAATAAPPGLPGGVGITVSPPGPSLPAPVLPAAGNTGRIAALPASP